MDGEIIPPAAKLPATVEPSAIPSARLGFTDGADGTRMVWGKYQAANMFGGGGLLGSGYGMPYGGGYGSSMSAAARTTREAALASAVAVDLLTSNPTLATLAENLATNAIGEGLTLSSKPDAVALGITPAEARDLSAEIERQFKAWAANPRECDLAGRQTLHQLAFQGFTSYLVTGELVATMDVRRCRDASTRTKVSLLDSNQLDRTKMGNGGGEGWTTFAGVHMVGGRIEGYWLRPYTPGQLVPAAFPKFLPVNTGWGRPRVLHVFEAKLPGQVRGMSPLVAALTPSHERNTLQGYALAAAMIGTAFAITVESDLGASASFAKLDAGGPSETFSDFVDQHKEFYGERGNKIDPRPATVNHLAPGDHLKFNKAEAPNSTYEAFEKSLNRSAAKAAGSSYEDVSGDYSQTSFSASRMATELPHRINLRRRALVAARFYQTAFECWLEEMVETGRIKVPASAPSFSEPGARAAYCAGKWLGLGRVQPDPKKAAEADILEIENGLASMSDKLAERGLDFDEMVATRKYEREQLAAAGLPVNEPGAVTTQRKLTEPLPPNPEDE